MPRKRASLGIMDDSEFRVAKGRAKEKPTPEMELKMKLMEKRSILAQATRALRYFKVKPAAEEV